MAFIRLLVLATLTKLCISKVVYEADTHDLVEAEAPHAHSLRPHASSTAAVCFAGHVRTLREMAPDIERYLLQAFPRHEAFFLLNMKESYTSWRINRFANSTELKIEDLMPVLKRLGAVVVETYDDNTYRRYGPRTKSACFDPKPPPGVWQRHGSQMWSISHCFEMVYAYENKRRSSVGPYRWIVRARPDAWPEQGLHDAIGQLIIGKAENAPLENSNADLLDASKNGTGLPMFDKHPRGKVWTSFGTGSDPLFIAERSAAPSLSSVWSEYLDSKCESLPGKGPCTTAAKVKLDTKTECLIDRHLRRFPDVKVLREDAIRTRLRRPTGFHNFIQEKKRQQRPPG